MPEEVEGEDQKRSAVEHPFKETGPLLEEPNRGHSGFSGVVKQHQSGLRSAIEQALPCRTILTQRRAPAMFVGSDFLATENASSTE